MINTMNLIKMGPRHIQGTPWRFYSSGQMSQMSQMPDQEEKKIKDPVKDPVKVSAEEYLRQLVNIGVDLHKKPWLKPGRISLRGFTEEQKKERRHIKTKIWQIVNKDRVSALKKRGPRSTFDPPHL